MPEKYDISKLRLAIGNDVSFWVYDNGQICMNKGILEGIIETKERIFLRIVGKQIDLHNYRIGAICEDWLRTPIPPTGTYEIALGANGITGVNGVTRVSYNRPDPNGKPNFFGIIPDEEIFSCDVPTNYKPPNGPEDLEEELEPLVDALNKGLSRR